MDWQTLYIILAISAATTSASLAVFGWRRRRNRITQSFAWLSIAVAFWALMYTLQVSTDNLAASLSFAKISYIGITPAPILFMTFTLIYGGYDHWLTRRNLTLLFAPSILVVLLVLTNDWHQLHWTDWRMETQSNGVVLLVTERGPSFWLFALYAYAGMLGALAVLLRLATQAGRLQQMEIRLLVVASGLIWLMNIVFISGISPLPGYDFTTLAYAGAGLIIGYLIEQSNILSSPPLVRDLIIDNLDHGMIVVDTSGRVAEINREAMVLLQPPTDPIGQQITDLLTPHADLLDLYQHLQEMQPEGPGDSTQHREEGKMTSNPERYVEMRITPLWARSGNFLGNLITLHDITHQRQVQIEAAQNFYELRAMRGIDARMTSTLDIDKVLESALHSAMSYSEAGAAMIALRDEGEEDYKIVHLVGEYPESLVNRRINYDTGITGAVLRTGEPLLVRDVSLDKNYISFCDGTRAQMTVPLRVHGQMIGAMTLETPFLDRFSDRNFEFVKGLADRVAVALENARLYSRTRAQVEELKKLNEQLRDLEQMKTDMIRIASHDLRNPLGTLVGYIDLLEMDKANLTPQHQSYVKTMLRLAERTQMIVSDILSLERLEEPESTMRGVNLTKIVNRVLNIFQDQIDSRGLTCKTHIDANPVRVWGDPIQITEAISNLVENAIKYTPQQGRIDITLSIRDEQAFFSVSDTGYGIAEDQQARLFEPFYRAIRKETQDIEGTGLGLHLVKNIIRRHQGEITFDSKVGRGSTFSFELPILPVGK